MERGQLITFEGGDGVGKTTQAQRLGDFLRARGVAVVTTREPGGTALGREIRRLLVTDGPTAPVARAELFLYLADRAQHVEEVIRPALAAGQWVICDRFVDSTIVYQGAGRGLGEVWLEALCRQTTGGLWPDLTLWLAVSPAEAGRRLAGRGGPDRLEAEGETFQRRLHDAFARRAAADPSRWLRIDTAAEVEAVATTIAWEVTRRYPHLAEGGQ
ncbi:MAG TPA: dTMP kinase [bacterium]|jgi:dTMP kinase